MKDDLNFKASSSLSENFASSAQRVVTIDVERYDQYIRDAGLSPAQKEEFLGAVFSIVMTFVELGFGIHPLQQVGETEPCGKDALGVDEPPKAALNGVISDVISEHKPKSRHGPVGRLEAE